MKKKLLDLKKTGSRDPDPAIKEVSNREVAVIGLALKLADYEDTGSFWKDVMYGCDRIGPFPPQRLEDTDSLLGFLANQMNGKADGAGSNYREMAYLDRIDTFDSRFFRLSPKDASAIDPAQRLFLETAWRAVEDSGYGGDRLRGERVGVFVGSVASGQYADIVSRVQPESFETIFAGNVPSNIAGRISYLLDWHGPAAVIDTACSSALVAVHTACRSIRNGECRMALAGTAKIVLTPVDVGQKAEISSADGRTRTFDNNSDGTGAGEGIIAVLLKPLHQAVKDNDHIYAVIKGSAVNQDGNAAGITVPNAEAQADVIRGAWKDAAIDPATIGYIEAHGTGTRLGDPIEIDGLTRAFSAFPDSDREQARAIGSVKANFGHLDNAAGLLGLVKAILCLQNRQIPPLVHFKEPNARIRFETSPVYVPEGLTDWRPPSPSGESPRRCGVSSFGLSGINCHMVVEEAPPPKTNETGDPVHGPHLLLISGKDAGALERYIDAYRFFLAARPEKDLNLNDLCATAATGRGHYNYRLALLFKDRGELDGQLDSLGREGIADCREQGIYYHGFTVVPEDAPSPGDDGVTYKEIKALGDQAKQLLTGIQRDLEGLAGLYVSGAEMDWIEFYTSGSHGFQKMSIPTYPLEKRRCWFQLPAPSTAPTANASRYSRVSDVDQAFLNFRLAETPDQVIYSVTLDPATSWLLKNHRVMGEPTLVGTAYYQMISEAAKQQGVTGPFEIKDLFIHRPLRVGEDKTLEVLALVEPGEGNLSFDFKLTGKDDNDMNGEWVTYASGRVGVVSGCTGAGRTQDSPLRSERLDLDAIMSRCGEVVKHDHQTPSTVEGGLVEVGPRWHCLRKVWKGDGERLGFFELDAEFHGDLEIYALHPPLLDAALHLGLEEPGYLPMACGSAKVFGSTPAGLYSWVKLVNNPGDETPAEVLQFDITLAAPDGTIIAVLEGYTVKRVRPGAGMDATVPDSGSLFHQLRWIETPLVSEPGEVVEGKTVALLGGSELLRREVREEILQTGGSVIESDMESAVSLVSRLEEDGVDGLLFLEPLNINMNYSSPEELPLEVAESVEVSFYRFSRFIQAVMRGGVGRRLDILTVACGTYNVTGAEPFLLPENALLSGLGKVIGQEAPNLRCRFLDMDGEPGVTAAQLVKELFNISDDTDYQAAYREGVRYVEELSGLEVSSSSVNTIKDGGVYLITGAFGGIGMEMARHFSSRHHVKLALLGRSRRYLPEGRDLWRGILEKGEDAKVCRNIQMVLDMESSGSEVMLLTADVSEEEQLEPVLEGVRRQWGGIDGIVHCAGVAGDGFLINKDEDSISDVLKPKVRGTRLLDRLTRVDRPGFMVLCSSLTALTGAPGQGDYTAANAFLDAFAAERGRVGLRTLSINWPAWSEVGMAVDHNALGNGPALGTEEALNNLDILLSTPNLPSSVILMKSFSGVQGAVFQKSPLVAEGKEDGNYSETETLLASVWGQVLGYDRISIYDNFYDLGGDSMNALEIRNLVSREMGMDISIADIFTHLTIAQMSSFLEGKRNSQETSAIVLGIRPSKSGEERPYYPVSPAQRRLYIFWKLAKETTAYNLPTALVVRGEVDHRRLEQAFRQLIRHHESLRTGFEHNGDQLVQVIVPSSGVDFFLHRREVSEERIEGYVKSFSRPFDLSKAPLLRAELVRSGERELLLFDVHHIAADAMSLEIMVSHLMRFYLGEELPFPSVHYRDFALWQEELLESGEVDRQKTYWLKQFETLPPPLDMPLDFPRPPVQTFAGAVSGFAVGAETAAGVRRMAVEAGTTPFTVYLSAFFILLYKFSRTEDIVIAVAESGRTDPLVKDMVGMFINNLAVRAFPLAEQEVLAFLNELKHVTLQSYAHQQYPFDALIQELDLPRDLSRNPLTDVTFSYMNFDQAEPGTEGLTFAPYPGQLKDSSKFDMAIFARETAGDVYFSIEYYSAIFTAETMERFGRYYLEVLKQMAADLSHSIGHLELMPHEERLHLLDTFNDTSAQYPADKTIHGLFEEQVERTPDKLAVLGNRVSVTYRMLNEKSGQLARTLAARGVQPDTIVGIMMERSADMVAGIIGILKSGGAYLPIDPGYPQERVDFMLRDSGTKIIVSNGLMVRKTKPGDGNELPNQQTIKPTNRQTNLAYIIYTSGSTGKPKGVMVEHKSITNLLFALNKNYPFGPGDTYLLKTSFVFDVSVSELFGWFMGGGRLAVLESGEEKDPRSILAAVKVFNVTHINFVPTAFNGFIDLLNAGQLPGLKTIFLAGETLPVDSVARFNRLGTGVPLENLYGPTEAAVYASFYSLGHWDGVRAIPIGKPLPNVRLYILNGYDGFQPIGIPGELCIGGAGLARGYLNRPDLTKEKFELPFPLYHTGDLARWLSDGNIEFMGRIDQQLKIRGFRIEPGEIEHELLEHKEIKEAVVVARPSGPDGWDLAAWFTGKRSFTGDEVREFLEGILPDYMVPSYFVQLEQLPLTAGGKLDRRALPEPSERGLVPGNPYVPARDELEETLVRIWEQVLDVKPIGIRDNFFKRGGHSLKATQVVSRVHRELSVEVSLRQLFMDPTIEGLAKAVRQERKSTFTAIPPVPAAKDYPVSYAQQRLWLLHHMEGGAVAYNMPGLFEVREEIDAAALQQAFQWLMERHETLRTAFVKVEGEPRQEIREHLDFKVKVMDFSEHETRRVQEFTDMELNAPFDLSKPPLLRVTLAKLGENHTLLLFALHHIVGDGWSIQVLFRELGILYDACREGKPNPLPPLPIQYKDFVVWQVNHGFEKQETYWLNQLTGAPEELVMPYDSPPGEHRDFAGDTETMALPNELTGKLREIALNKNTTLSILYFSVYIFFLSWLTKQEDLCVGMASPNRNRRELENLIGFFVNMLPIRIRLDRDIEFEELLDQVAERCYEAFENQDYPFDLLIRELNPHRRGNRPPLLNVMYEYQGFGNLNLELGDMAVSPAAEATGGPNPEPGFDVTFKTSKADLTLFVIEQGDTLQLKFEYDTGLFLPQTIGRYFTYLERFSNAVADELTKKTTETTETKGTTETNQ